jgi:hypothetical protein
MPPAVHPGPEGTAWAYMGHLWAMRVPLGVQLESVADWMAW